MESGVLRGIGLLRVVAWLWMAAVVVLARGSLERPWAAALLVGAALAVTVADLRLLRMAPGRLTAPTVVGAELAVGAALLLADGWVYDRAHVFSTEQSLGVAWPLAGVLTAGAAWGPGGGTLAGVGMGAACAVSAILWGPGPAPDDPEVALGLGAAQALSLISTAVLYAVAGGVAGYAVRVLRRAERRLAEAEVAMAEVRAREQMARTLHDGVLQTLALVERRSDDEALARLARDQDRELRRYLFGTGSDQLVGTGTLGDRLREVAGRAAAAHGFTVDVLVPDDLPPLDDVVGGALVGAVGEALANAGKHAAPTRVVVLLEPDGEGVFCSVRDDGAGFEPAAVTEVRLHVPADPRPAGGQGSRLRPGEPRRRGRPT